MVSLGDTTLRADPDVVALALRNDGVALKTREEIVAIAVQQNGLALQFASDSLRSKTHLVTLALHNNGEALCFAAPCLWDDPDIIAAAKARWPLRASGWILPGHLAKHTRPSRGS